MTKNIIAYSYEKKYYKNLGEDRSLRWSPF